MDAVKLLEKRQGLMEAARVSTPKQVKIATTCDCGDCGGCDCCDCADCSCDCVN